MRGRIGLEICPNHAVATKNSKLVCYVIVTHFVSISARPLRAASRAGGPQELIGERLIRKRIWRADSSAVPFEVVRQFRPRKESQCF